MHAASCPAPTGMSGGTTSAQAAIACGQRVRKTQPEGGASGDGSSPASAVRAARASAASPRAAPIRGVLASRARLYGWRGAVKSAAFGARSITRPLDWLRLFGRKLLLTINAAEIADTESIEAYAESAPLLHGLLWLDFGMLID